MNIFGRGTFTMEREKLKQLKTANQVAVWTYLCAKAPFAEVEWTDPHRRKTVKLQAGELAIKLSDVASDLRLPKQSVFDCLKALLKLGFLTRFEPDFGETSRTVPGQKRPCTRTVVHYVRVENHSQKECIKNTPGQKKEVPRTVPGRYINNKDNKLKSINTLSRLMSIWNENCGEALPKVESETESRKRMANARWKQKGDEGYWLAVVRKIADSPFCRGEIEPSDGRVPWRANFDWLLKPDSHVKVMEGVYDERSRPSGALDERPRHLRAVTSLAD